MQRTVLLALTLGLLTASPALAADLFKPVNATPSEEKSEALQGVGVFAPLGCSLGSGQTPLPEGTGVTGNLSATTGANCEFVYTPPLTLNGAKIVMTLTTSDFDLYVRKGAVPTTSLYDCRPFSGGLVTETCLSPVTDATPIYVMVRRFSGSGDFTVTASATTLHPNCPTGNLPLAVGGTASYSTPVALGAACYFQLTPGADDDLVRFNAVPEGAAYGIYVKRGSVPTTSSYDCISSASFLVRTCELVADGQDMFVMVRRSTSSGLGQFSLNATSTTLPSLTVGTAIQSQVAQSGYVYYKLVAPAGSKLVGVAIGSTSPTYACSAAAVTVGQPVCGVETGPYTNADLYVGHVSKGRLPTTLTSSYDCRSIAKGTNDACVFSTEAAGALTQAGLPSELGTDPAFGNGPVNVKPYAMDGKYLIGVRGATGPADYVITGVFA